MFSKPFPALTLSMALLLLQALPAFTAPSPVIGFAFDWDDNIFNMPTEIKLVHRKTGKNLGVATDEFALIREEIGKAGTPYADYYLKEGLADGSLRYFGDKMGDGVNHFKKDVQRAIKAGKIKGRHWQGPSWEAFVEAMKNPKTAAETRIITARLHDPKTIYESLRWLKKQGYIRNIPPIDNIWPVANPGFQDRFAKVFKVKGVQGSAQNPSQAKAEVMKKILDRIQSHGKPKGREWVLRPDAKGMGQYHLWGFSDDDFGNFKKASEALQVEVDRGSWPDVKLSLFFTGKNRPDTPPHAVVLQAKMPPRPFSEAEGVEWKNLVRRFEKSSAPQSLRTPVMELLLKVLCRNAPVQKTM